MEMKFMSGSLSRLVSAKAPHYLGTMYITKHADEDNAKFHLLYHMFVRLYKSS